MEDQDLSVHLVCGDARATISLRGAEPTSWNVGGRALIRSPSSIWNASAPVLFPMVGWARDGMVRVDGQYYAMGVHGFAASSDFTLASSSSDSARFVLQANDATWLSYPFDFALTLDYRLDDASLSVEMEIVNTGRVSMPYACGLHPGFRWPFSGGVQSDYAIRFEQAEVGDVPEITSGGLFTSRKRRIQLNGRDLALTPDLFAREALCFLNARSTSLAFIAPDGARIELAVQGFPHLALWSKPGANFLSIECWTGHGDMEDFDGELRDKPSMIVLAPGETRRHTARMTFTA